MDRADLLVVGTHGRRGWSRLRNGSIAADLLTNATTNALCAPAHHGRQTHGIERVLIVSDLTSASAEAERLAFHMLDGQVHPRVHVLHVPA
jgi:hypothetical protein